MPGLNSFGEKAPHWVETCSFAKLIFGFEVKRNAMLRSMAQCVVVFCGTQHEQSNTAYNGKSCTIKKDGHL